MTIREARYSNTRGPWTGHGQLRLTGTDPNMMAPLRMGTTAWVPCVPYTSVPPIPHRMLRPAGIFHEFLQRSGIFGPGPSRASCDILRGSRALPGPHPADVGERPELQCGIQAGIWESDGLQEECAASAHHHCGREGR